ncbi:MULTISPECIES: transporter family protein [Cellulophaga]|uniref:Transporter n=1 Tax=Cellulophaga baltica 18 TaxID=1348584 RepID=A0AAU8R983_9FLAO|nr:MULTISPECIES: hypothetical protein [Cellulophaga]AIZ40556.1 hypothetical protein M666_02575 [Cellulophaga baltica 18]KGK29925.1 hypothetical protein EL45_13080 [Cellulophaga sp. E6(2014)]MCR1025372.1 transporter [Cellulophaga baltica]WFO15460.1 transporter [Cellulophaga baltica 4]
MKNKNYIALAVLVLATSFGFAQDEEEKSNIQQYTPSKLIGKGQYDVKWFNNLYTQTESTFSEGKEPRQTFFTSSLEAYTGVGENKRWNVGAILEFRSNVINDRSALDVFKFDGEESSARSGLTSIAPSVKFVPFTAVSNFSIQSSFFIPLVDNETENGVFLDQKGYTWQNRFFYDYTFPGDKWQLFSELNSELHFGDKEESFANNSLSLTPGLFLSYFPSSKFTVLALAQHSQRLDLGNDFSQDFTAVGGGAKYQLTKALNLELLYTNFVRGSNTGLGETFNLGLRGIF